MVLTFSITFPQPSGSESFVNSEASNQSVSLFSCFYAAKKSLPFCCLVVFLQ
jgi:hypothetical protein